MTSKQIADQIETLRKVGEELSGNPEATVAFLRAANIITDADVAAWKAKNNVGANNSQTRQPSGTAMAVSSNNVKSKTALSPAGHVAAKKSK